MRQIFLGLLALLLAACSLAPTTSKVVRFEHAPNAADLAILQDRILQSTGEKARWVPQGPGEFRVSSYALPSDDGLAYLFNHRGQFRAVADGQILLERDHVTEMLAEPDAKGGTIFHFALSNEGVQRFSAYEHTHAGKQVRFELDEELLAEVPMRGLLQGGKFQLTLGKPPKEAGLTAVVLRSGRLSTPVKLVSVTTDAAQ